MAAAQVLAIIFKSANISKISDILNKKLPYQNGFLLDRDSKSQIKSLCLDLCDQFAPGFEVKEQLLMAVSSQQPCAPFQNCQFSNNFHIFPQTVICLRFLAEILQNSRKSARKVSLSWLVKKVARQTRLEVARAPLQYSVVSISVHFGRYKIFKNFGEFIENFRDILDKLRRNP